MVNSVTGVGYDSHRFRVGRKLILGGVSVPYDLGLDGHSDADALCHAIMDAMLGATGKPDIGHLFPDTDNQWKDASSIELLRNVGDLIKDEGSRILYIDSVIIAQKPKLSPFILEMRSNIAQVLGISSERVNIKAKTNERMGFTGRGEGVSVITTLTLERNFND